MGRLEIRKLAIGWSLLALVGAGCSGTPGTPTGSAGPAPSAAATEAAPASRAPLVLEDSGVDVELAPGTYVSRVFTPSIRLELGTGWFRRDVIGPRAFNLRAGPNGDRDLSFISGVDFLQCDMGKVVTTPDASAIVAAIEGSPALTVKSRREVPVGSRRGTELRLVADPDAVLPDDLDRWTQLGCMLSQGDAPFPAEGGWIGATADMDVQFIVLDAAGTSVLVRGRGPSDADAHYDAVLDIVARMTLG